MTRVSIDNRVHLEPGAVWTEGNGSHWRKIVNVEPGYIGYIDNRGRGRQKWWCLRTTFEKWICLTGATEDRE